MALMVADHFLAVGMAVVLARGVGVSPGIIEGLQLVRLTVTRLALPLFMGVSGYLLADRDRPSSRRQVHLVVAAVVSQLAFTTLPGLSQVDVLVVIVFVHLAWPVLRRHAVEFAALGMLAAVNLTTLPYGWTGYSPALVAAFMCLGALAAKQNVDRRGRRPRRAIPLPRFFAAVGSRPLSAYVAHLGFLFVVVHLFHLQ